MSELPEIPKSPDYRWETPGAVLRFTKVVDAEWGRAAREAIEKAQATRTVTAAETVAVDCEMVFKYDMIACLMEPEGIRASDAPDVKEWLEKHPNAYKVTSL